MIRKLRLKLILVSMLSLSVILCAIFTAISILNYRDMIRNADDILEILADNDGSFPVGDGQDDSLYSSNSPGQSGWISPELPYETRYFSVFLSQDGTVLSVNTEQITAVDDSAAVGYARTIADTGQEKGIVDDYRYISYSDGDELHIIFLDCGRRMNTFRTLLLTYVGVSVLGLAAVALLLTFFSGRIVRPFLKNQEKQKQFITDAGHELKTPLTIIDADAEVLEMDIGENEWLRDIQNQTKRLSGLTNDLILLSRMDECPQSEKIDFPISDLAEETLETFQTLARTQNKTLTCRIQPLLSMSGDEKAIQRLLSILLDNAIKYSNEGGNITLTLEKQKNLLQLCVFNTAESVSKESFPHLFDRFYRAEQSRNSQTGGYGLGLSIASAIVRSHKGKITAGTQDGKSLLITVTFPV